MSQQIICRQCESPNTPGSKFCNNCGNRLAPSTNYICPNCSTPNPKNRFYCDNCGTRLVQDKIPSPDKPKTDATESGSKIFSLPARKPGETGELDPSTIPDWLRTGKTKDTPAIPEELLDGNMPRIEDLQPQEGQTGDLPDWLTGTDSDPVFEPPAAITTEHYLELIQSGKTDDDFDLSAFNDDLPGASASDAELPDWLSDLDQPEIEEEVESDAETIIPDWLPNLQKPTASETPQATASTADVDESEDAFDWLESDGAEETAVTPPQDDFPFDFDEKPAQSTASELDSADDWAGNFGDGLTAFLSDAGVEPDMTAAATTDEGDFPDWLQDQEETAVADTNDDFDDFADMFGDEDTIVSPATDSSTAEDELDDLPDWLGGSADEADFNADETIAVSAEGDNLLANDDDFPDWLMGDGGADDKAEETDNEAYKEMTGWLSALNDDESPDAVKSASDDDFDLFASDDDFSDWDTAEETTADDEFDWLTEDTTSEPAVVAETAIEQDLFGADDIDLDNWLTESDDEAPPIVLAGEEAVADDAIELDDWLADDSSAADDFFTAEPEEITNNEVIGDLDDFLSDSDDDFGWMDDTPETDAVAETAVAADESLDWLADDDAPIDDLFGDSDDDFGSNEVIGDVDDFFSDSDDDFGWMDDTPETDAVAETAVGPDSELDLLAEPESDSTADFFTADFNEADAWGDDLDDVESTDEESLDWLAELGTPDTSSLLDSPGTGFLIPLDDEEGDVDLDFSALQDESIKELGDDSMPDWLGGKGSSDSDRLDLALTGLLGEEESMDGGLDWLTPLEDEVEEPVVEEEPEPSQIIEDEGELEAEPDWLTAFLTGELPAKPAGDAVPADMLASQRDDLPDIDDLAADFELEDEFNLFDETPAASDEFDDLGDLLPEQEPIKLDSDIVFAENMIGDSIANDWIAGEESEEEELPDWLTELGASVDEPVETPSSFSASEDLPDWVSDLRPGERSDTGSLSAPRQVEAAFEDLPDEFAGEELSDAGLPDWLHEAIQDEDVEVDERAVAMGAVATAQSRQSDSYDDLLESSDGLEDLEYILSDLPPADPLGNRLPKADIPDWIEDLKPPELTSAGPLPEPELEPEASGPLVGLAGTIAVQETSLPDYKPSIIPQFTVTKEQQQQVALLRQLTQGERKLSSDIEYSRESTSLILRLAIAGLIIAAILAGLFGPLLIAPEDAPIPPHVADLETAVSAAAGQPVLVAFEYTPAMAGQLSVPTAMLLSQLEENGSPVMVVSQYAAGITLAEAYISEDEGISLGIVPGEAVGLRLLANCLGANAYCQSFMSRPVDGDLREALQEVALIIVVTGERDSLVNWVEQIGSSVDVPVVATVTEAMAPIAAPYYASGQLSGVMSGGLEAAVYQARWPQDIDGDAYLRQINAQTLAILAAAIILIVGGLVFSIKRPATQKKKA